MKNPKTEIDGDESKKKNDYMCEVVVGYAVGLDFVYYYSKQKRTK